jgi:hypothetical protein
MKYWDPSEILIDEGVLKPVVERRNRLDRASTAIAFSLPASKASSIRQFEGICIPVQYGIQIATKLV